MGYEILVSTMEIIDVLLVAFVMWIAWELISNDGDGGRRSRLPVMG